MDRAGYEWMFRLLERVGPQRRTRHKAQVKPTIHAIGAVASLCSPGQKKTQGGDCKRGHEVMEEENEGGGSHRSRTYIPNHYWWALVSTGQFGWAISAYRRGYAGDHRLMPFKAFGVASLFICASASAAVASLQASGIHKVEDLVELGASIRNGLGIAKRARDE